MGSRAETLCLLSFSRRHPQPVVDDAAGFNQFHEKPLRSVVQTQPRGNGMAVKIFITRKGIDKNIIELTVLLKKMRSLTLNQPGYIYGETLRRIDQPDECVVISTWRSREDWDNWFNSPQRQSVQSEIDLLLGDTTEYAVYEE